MATSVASSSSGPGVVTDGDRWRACDEMQRRGFIAKSATLAALNLAVRDGSSQRSSGADGFTTASSDAGEWQCQDALTRVANELLGTSLSSPYAGWRREREMRRDSRVVSGRPMKRVEAPFWSAVLDSMSHDPAGNAIRAAIAEINSRLATLEVRIDKWSSEMGHHARAPSHSELCARMKDVEIGLRCMGERVRDLDKADSNGVERYWGIDRGRDLERRLEAVYGEVNNVKMSLARGPPPVITVAPIPSVPPMMFAPPSPTGPTGGHPPGWWPRPVGAAWNVSYGQIGVGAFAGSDDGGAAPPIPGAFSSHVADGGQDRSSERLQDRLDALEHRLFRIGRDLTMLIGDRGREAIRVLFDDIDGSSPDVQLYGSLAAGTHTEASDIDLFVVEPAHHPLTDDEVIARCEMLGPTRRRTGVHSHRVFSISGFFRPMDVKIVRELPDRSIDDIIRCSSTAAQLESVARFKLKMSRHLRERCGRINSLCLAMLWLWCDGTFFASRYRQISALRGVLRYDKNEQLELAMRNIPLQIDDGYQNAAAHMTPSDWELVMWAIQEVHAGREV